MYAVLKYLFMAIMCWIYIFSAVAILWILLHYLTIITFIELKMCFVFIFISVNQQLNETPSPSLSRVCTVFVTMVTVSNQPLNPFTTKLLRLFLSLSAVWNWTVMGQLRLHFPLRNIWNHCFMIPHGPLILLRIFTTHLTSFPHCNRSISPDRTLTIVRCYGALERAKCFFPRWRKRPFILTCNFLGVSRPTAAGFRNSRKPSGILSLWANQLINQNPPALWELAILMSTWLKPLISESFDYAETAPFIHCYEFLLH